MRIKGIRLSVIIITIVLTISFSTAVSLAYFSDYVKARGSAALHLTGKTEITETPGTNSKTIIINNRSDFPVDMITRVQVIGPDEFAPYSIKGEPENWEKGSDGWWYYTKVLEQGASTDPLTIEWAVPSGTEIKNYDVAVVHESMAAVYGEDGTVQIPADSGWESHIN